MELPGISDEKEVRQLLKKLKDGEDDSRELKFAVVARGPKDGELLLSRIEKLKRKDVLAAAEPIARQAAGGKPVKLDVLAGLCSLAPNQDSVLLLRVEGKVASRAVACVEYLLTVGVYKTLGFRGVVFEELVENDGTSAPVGESGGTTTSPPSEPSPLGTSTPVSSEEAEQVEGFKRRLAAVLSALERGGVGAAGPSIRLAASEAGARVRQRDFGAAEKLLNAAEKLLRESATDASPVAPGPTTDRTPEPSGPSGKSKVRFETLHLAWDSAKQEVREALARLHQAIVGQFTDPTAQTAATKLDAVLARFNEGLGDRLDELRNAETVEARAEHASRAAATAERYLDSIANDPLVTHVEANPFQIRVAVRETLVPPLRNLLQELERFTA